VASRGRKTATPGVVLQALERRRHQQQRPPGQREGGDDSEVRVGFTASRKVGNAVERNRARRRLKAAVREVFPIAAQPGRDYVLVARRTTLARPWDRLLMDLRSALERVEEAEGRGSRRRHRQAAKRA